MDHAAASELELHTPQHHQPHHPPSTPYAAPPPQPHLFLLSSPSYYPSPNPSPLPLYGSPNPAPAPAAAPYLPDPYTPHGGYYASAAAGASAGTVGGMAGYFYERIGGNSYGSAAIGHAHVAPGTFNGFDPAAAVAPPQWGARSNYKGGRKKGSKPTKVAQSAHCLVCKIACDTQEVLNTHKQGKKHKKNLQKLQELITPKPQGGQVTAHAVEKKEDPAPVLAPVPAPEKEEAPAPFLAPVPAPEEEEAPATASEKDEAPDPDNGKAVLGEGKTIASKKAKRKEASEEDVEVKKMRMLKGGAEPKELRVCILCNVVANSETVYASHIAGSKHAEMVKKQEETAAS